MSTSENDNDSTENLIWIDLEMTGLDTEADTIIEIATIVTDKQLRELAEGPVFVIGQSQTSWTRWMNGTPGIMASPD